MDVTCCWTTADIFNWVTLSWHGLCNPDDDESKWCSLQCTTPRHYKIPVANRSIHQCTDHAIWVTTYTQNSLRCRPTSKSTQLLIFDERNMTLRLHWLRQTSQNRFISPYTHTWHILAPHNATIRHAPHARKHWAHAKALYMVLVEVGGPSPSKSRHILTCPETSRFKFKRIMFIT